VTGSRSPRQREPSPALHQAFATTSVIQAEIQRGGTATLQLSYTIQSLSSVSDSVLVSDSARSLTTGKGI